MFVVSLCFPSFRTQFYRNMLSLKVSSSDKTRQHIDLLKAVQLITKATHIRCLIYTIINTIQTRWGGGEVGAYKAPLAKKLNSKL